MARKILVAEDDPNIVLSLEFLLTQAGHEVTIAVDGAAAIEQAESLRPDLVLLDVMLPAFDGFEVCRRIRQNHATRHIKILMLTARGRESEINKGFASGADVYMTKPFATRELMDTVTALLGATRD